MSFNPGTLLNVGGTARAPGWTVVNIVPGPHVDIVADCCNLARVPDGSCAMVYASHVLQTLGADVAVPRALAEFRRVLMPGGKLLVAVPDLDAVCRWFVDPALTREERLEVLRLIYGGRADPFDVNVSGFTAEILGGALNAGGFVDIRREGSFGLFDDASARKFRGQPASLNMSARRPG